MTAPNIELHFEQMTQEEARAVAGWHYEPPYDFYVARADQEDLSDLLNAGRRAGRTFTARDESGEIVGFFTYRPEDEAIVVGLGLRPDLTGRGLGAQFVAAGLAFGRELFRPLRFQLSVATFNERAIKVYERAGFVRTRTFDHATNGGVFPFLEMERLA